MGNFSWVGARVAMVAGSLAVATAVSAQTVVDWNDSSSGMVNGVAVTFSGGSMNLISEPLWVDTVFNLANMSAPVGGTEGIEFRAGASAPDTYTVTFASAVSGVMLHLGSLASTLVFDRPVFRLSGQPTFVVNGNSVSGAMSNGGPFSDANGSVFLGDLSSFTFTSAAGPFGAGEGVGIQVVTGISAPVPEPTSLLLMAAGLLLIGGTVRRKVEPGSAYLPVASGTRVR